MLRGTRFGFLVKPSVAGMALQCALLGNSSRIYFPAFLMRSFGRAERLKQTIWQSLVSQARLMNRDESFLRSQNIRRCLSRYDNYKRLAGMLSFCQLMSWGE